MEINIDPFRPFTLNRSDKVQTLNVTDPSKAATKTKSVEAHTKSTIIFNSKQKITDTYATNQQKSNEKRKRQKQKTKKGPTQ